MLDFFSHTEFKKKIRPNRFFAVAFIAVMLTTHAAVFAGDFQSTIEAYSKNQKSIKTLVASGVMSLEVRNVTTDQLMTQMKQPMTIYLKFPDLFKITISGATPTSMVQKGKFITQKMPGTNTLMTNKVDQNSDLFQKYFSYGIDENMQNVHVQSQKTVIEGNSRLTVFSFTVPSNAGGTGNGLIATPNTTELYFNENSMLVRSILYSNGLPIITANFTYKAIGNIFVVSGIASDVLTTKARMKTTISYTGLSINTQIADQEFEMR